MATITINTRGSISEDIMEKVNIICNDNMDMIVSDTDLSYIRAKYPEAYGDIYIVNDKRVDDVECTRDGHQGITLSYTIDGIPFSVTGEFMIDKAGVLHHMATDPKDENNDIEILVQYK